MGNPKENYNKLHKNTNTKQNKANKPLLNNNKMKKKLKIKVPSYRFDIAIAEDLVEEVARIYGYNKLSNITIAEVKGDRTGSAFSFSDDTITRAGSGNMTADEQGPLAATNVSSSGTGLTATITTSTTASTAIVINNPGQGYAVNDTVKFTKDSKEMTFTIAAVKETLGGIPIEYINETHVAGTSASGSTSGAQILSDIDSYLITIPSSVWPTRVEGSATTGNIQTASESADGGGNNVTATANAYYDVIHTAIPSFELPNTRIETLKLEKVIFKDKIREARTPLLAAEDVVYMKALEAGDSSAQAASVTKKKALRDAPAASAISSADTIAKLKAAWDTSTLGDSPYA